MSYNFADLFEHAVDAMPDRIAVIAQGREVSFRELESRANQLAHHLTAAGIDRGDHVGFHMHNSIETLETLIACFKIRAVPVNINYRYTSAELRYVYDNADLVALVHHRTYSRSVAEVLPSVPSIRHTLVVEDDLDSVDELSDSLRYEEALNVASTARDFAERSSDDLFIMYTGGTTGQPKGVVWRQEDIWRVIGGGIDFHTGQPITDEYHQSRTGVDAAQISRWFAVPPLIHAAAMMPSFTALWSGNTVILESKFDPAKVWQVVARDKVTCLIITGDAMGRPLVDAYRAAPVDTSALAMVVSGAALLSQSVKNELLELFPTLVVADSIGSSETGYGGMGFAQKSETATRGPKVQTGRGALVVTDDGRPVEVGQEGWLAKTGSVPIGYYKDQEKTDRLFKTVEGIRMVITDDRAIVEEGGFITLLGRGNMVINTGGEKVFAEEVESIVKSHADVYDAIVIGVPDERWGHQVSAVVSSRTSGPIDFASLEQHVRTHLAGYKVPRRIWVTDQVVRTPSGKPDYRRAKAYAASREPDHRV
ncbi:acyl-CoA synthetase [Nocardia sp. NPDC004123]